MTYNEKKSLYENIMKDIAKIVKTQINEDNSYNDKKTFYEKLTKKISKILKNKSNEEIEKENNIIPENTKECAKRWIESGKPCRYRNGFGFRGASSRELSKEEALKLLPKYDFGMGFYELSFEQDRKVDSKQSGRNCTVTYPYGPIVLMFNEYDANDMY